MQATLSAVLLLPRQSTWAVKWCLGSRSNVAERVAYMRIGLSYLENIKICTFSSVTCHLQAPTQGQSVLFLTIICLMPLLALRRHHKCYSTHCMKQVCYSHFKLWFQSWDTFCGLPPTFPAITNLPQPWFVVMSTLGKPWFASPLQTTVLSQGLNHCLPRSTLISLGKPERGQENLLARRGEYMAHSLLSGCTSIARDSAFSLTLVTPSTYKQFEQAFDQQLRHLCFGGYFFSYNHLCFLFLQIKTLKITFLSYLES